MSHVTEDASNYRPDIDGMRAVAVSLVVVFHMSPEAVPFGFLGVDIFFMISGFVVTLAVLRQRQRSTWEALLEFWKRRVARIYPVLLVSLIATLCLSVLLLPGFPLVVYNGVLRTALRRCLGCRTCICTKAVSIILQTTPIIPFFTLGHWGWRSSSTLFTR